MGEWPFIYPADSRSTSMVQAYSGTRKTGSEGSQHFNMTFVIRNIMLVGIEGWDYDIENVKVSHRENEFCQ